MSNIRSDRKDEAILDKVLAHYPTPIAMPARWMLEGVHRGDTMRHFWNGVLDTYEATVHFLALVQLRDYLDKDAPSEDYNMELLKTLRRDLSLGHWAGMVRELTRRLVSAERPMFLQNLGNLMGADDWLEAAKPLDSLVTERNRTRGHPDKVLGARDFETLIQKNRPLLLSLLGELSFLADTNLVGVVSWVAPGSVVIREALVFKGKDPDSHFHTHYDHEVTIPLIPGEREGLLLLHHARAGEWLKLGPVGLLRQDLTNDTYHAYFLNALDINKGRLRKANFRSYARGAEALTIPSREDQGTAWLRLMTGWLNEGLRLREEEKLQLDKSMIDPRAVRILARKQIGFTGRDKLLAKVEGIAAGSGAIVYVKGPKGQGKSAFMAHLVQRSLEREISVLYYFFSQTDGTAGVETALYHLLAQAFGSGLASSPPRNDAGVDELLRDLVSALRAGHESRRRRVPWVVLDGLDEVENRGAGLERLWAEFERLALEGRTAIILAGREEPPVAGPRLVELEGLTDEEVREVLLRHGHSATTEFASQLRASMAGNPLLLVRFLDSARDAIADCEIPAFTAGWQTEEISRLLETARGQGVELPFCEVATLLAATAEPLSLSMMRNLVGMPDGQLSQVFRLLSPVLVGATSLAYFHQSIREVVAEIIGLTQIRAAHASLADWCLANDDEPYTQHLVRHLLGAGRSDEAVANLSLDQTRARVERDEPLENVLADVRRVVVASNSEPGHLPGLCQILRAVGELISEYVTGADFPSMVERGECGRLASFANYVNPPERRRLLVSALLSADSDPGGGRHASNELRQEVSGLNSGGLRRALTAFVRCAGMSRSGAGRPKKQSGKPDAVADCRSSALPGMALRAAIAGDCGTALKALARFAKTLRPAEQGDELPLELAKSIRRCLMAINFLPRKSRRIIDKYRAVADADPCAVGLVAVVDGDPLVLTKWLRRAATPKKPGELRESVILANLAGELGLAEETLRALAQANYEEYRKALITVVSGDDPSPGHLLLIDDLIGGDEIRLLTVCTDLVGVGKRVVAARVAAASAAPMPQTPAGAFEQLTEEAVSILAAIAPQRAERLIPLIKAPARRAMAWAVLASARNPDAGEIRPRACALAEEILHEEGRPKRGWLRVREMLAVARDGGQEALAAFWELAEAVDGRDVVALARPLANHLGNRGLHEQAYAVAKRLVAYLGHGGRKAHRGATVLQWVAFFAARDGAGNVAASAMRDMTKITGPGEVLARGRARLAFAAHLRGDQEKAVAEFAQAVHLARNITMKAKPDKLDAWGISSALHWVSIDEFRAGLDVEAHAHAQEAWDRLWRVKRKRGRSDWYPLVEILGTMAFIGLSERAVQLADALANRRRGEQARGFIARGLVSRAAVVPRLTEDERRKDLSQAHSLLSSIQSASGRQAAIEDAVESLIPRRASYMTSDPLPAARPLILEFLLGTSGQASPALPGVLPANLTSPTIVRYGIRVWLRMLTAPEHVDVVEQVFRFATGSGPVAAGE